MSLGEGACSQGEFWEALNTACTLHLPVLFVVADNGYAISVPSDDQHPAPVSELVRGFRGLAIHKMDGRDYFEVRQKGKKAIERVRAGEGPGLIHAIVTRPYSHSLSDDQRKYRPAEELAEEQEYDPIDQLERELVQAGMLSPDEAKQIRDDAKAHVVQAANEALAARRPDPATVLENITGPLPEVIEPDDAGTGEVVTFGEAIRLTLHEVMERDERVRVFGEDVADAASLEKLEHVPGQGRSVRDHARTNAAIRDGPLLQHTAGRGQHRRQSDRTRDPRLASVAGDPVLRLHLDGHAADPHRGRDDALAFQRRIQGADGAAGTDRRLLAGRLDLALAVG